MKTSVCIATYNGEKYIKHQLNSILMQLEENDEVIISDDSSTDKTVEIIEGLKDDRIRLFKKQLFKNPVLNFEYALKKATGDYIFLSDQDDVWLNSKINILKKFLKNYNLVISDAIVVDENLKKIHPSFYKLNHSRKGFINNLIKNSYLGCAIGFDREILDKALPFPKDIPMHDWWIGLIAEAYGKTFFYDKPLILYRRHEDNFSKTGETSKYHIISKIMFRLIMIKNIIYKTYL